MDTPVLIVGSYRGALPSSCQTSAEQHQRHANKDFQARGEERLSVLARRYLCRQRQRQTREGR